VDANGDTLWVADGVPICAAADDQEAHQLVGDGSGGAIITWEDRRGATADIYAQRVDANGDTLWTADGVPICTVASNCGDPQLMGDGSGGTIITWRDSRNGNYDIYAQRLDANGDTLWSADGVAICTAANHQYSPQLISDGSGGAVITWYDYRSGSHYDVYAQSVDASGNTQWAADGVAICNAANSQSLPQLISDGLGGAIITWRDDRSGSHFDVYAQRVGADGNVLWPTNGAAICTVANDQKSVQLTGDGIGGAIIIWEDQRSGTWDIYAQRVGANGHSLWAADGVPICTAADNQRSPQLISDGFGGGVIAWDDHRSGKTDIYAQWVDANGNILWPVNGEAICTAADYEYYPQLAGDGSGGAIITWEDSRNGNDDIYAQRILGPVPRIVSISDVPNDQGREVSILWDRSYLDDPQYMLITDYTIWRKYPQGSKIESFGVEWDESLTKDLTQRVYIRVEREDGKTEYWELIGTVDAAYLDGYAYVAPTLEDSSASGAPYFSFFVSASTADPFIHWPSDPDSGYSVDDVSPAPTLMTIAHGSTKSAKGFLDLSWQQVTTGTDGSPETGPIQYNIYCDTTAWFTPAPGNLLTTTQDLTYAHSDARIGNSSSNLFYLVTATDGSGNQSEISNRTGEYDYDLKTTTGTDYTWAVFCLGDTNITMASDLEAYIEAHSSPATNCLSISGWNPVAQGYTSYTTVPIPMGDFALTPGAAYRIEVTADAVWTLVGDVLDTDVVSFDLKTTTGTDYTWVSVPLQLDTLAMASDLEAHIQAHSDPVTDCLSISEWNPVAQGYTSYTTIPIPMGDFAIRAGRAYRVEVTADAAWPVSGKRVKTFQKALRSE
jgi:hypothetical protein